MSEMVITKNMTLDDIISDFYKFDFALIYEFSDVMLFRINKENPDQDNINWDECLEVYLFNEDKQIHAYRRDGELVGKQLSDQELNMPEQKTNPEFVDRKYELDNKFLGVGKTITVREYLAPDEDGQMHVVYTRLVCVE